MTPTKERHPAVATFETPTGGCLEIEVVVHVLNYPPSGHAHLNPPFDRGGPEVDWIEPIRAHWYHPDNGDPFEQVTTIELPAGSMAYILAEAFLERNWSPGGALT